MKKKERKITSPNAALYWVIQALLRPYLVLIHNYSIKKPKCKLKGPSLVVASHTSKLDFLYSLCALYPLRVNYVVSSFFYRHNLIKKGLIAFKAIPKDQFVADIKTIRQLQKLVKNNGSAIIYPEGEINGTGRTGEFAPGIGRLAKLLRCNIYGVRVYGGYFSYPKWSEKHRKGKVCAEVFCIASAKQVEGMTDKELDEIISREIYVDDFKWQEQNRVPYRGLVTTEGLQNLLYECPKCGMKHMMAAEDERLICQNCNNTVRIDEYGFLNAVSPNDVAVKNVADWVAMEKESLAMSLTDESEFAFETFVLAPKQPGSLAFAPCGSGVLKITPQTFSYVGTQHDEAFELELPMRQIYKLPFSIGKHFELNYNGKMLLFGTKKPQEIMEIVYLVETIRKKFYQHNG